MAQGDFVIPPSEGLSMPGGSSYGTAISSLRQAGAGVQDIFSELGKAANQLYAIRNDQMEAASQGDLLHIINDLNDTAAQLGSDPNGMTAIYSDTGNVDEQGNAEKAISGYNLGAAWEKKMDDWQKVLTEKYAAFPTIQTKVLTQFRDAAVSANKYAIDAAAKNSLEQGKTESLNNIQMGIQAAIKSGGDTSQLDATLANPSTVNFLGKSTVEAQRTAAYKTVGDSVLQNQLDNISVTAGPETALSAIPEWVDEQTANKLKSRIALTSSAALGAMNNQAVKDYGDNLSKGMLDADAKALALQKSPDWAKDDISKTVDTFATQWWKQKDDSGQTTAISHALQNGAKDKDGNPTGSGWIATELWFQNPDTVKQLGMSPDGYQQELSFIKSMANDERARATAKTESIDWSKSEMIEGSKYAVLADKSESDKLNKFSQWVTSGKIDGAEFHALASSIKGSDNYLSEYIGRIHALSSVNPNTGAVIPGFVSPEQASEAAYIFNKKYRQLSDAGKPPSNDDMEKLFQQTKALLFDSAIAKAVDASFANTAGGLLGPISRAIWPNDDEGIKNFTIRLQNGQLSEIADITQVKSMINAMLPAQQKDFQGRIDTKTHPVVFKPDAIFGKNGFPIYEDQQKMHWAQVYNDATKKMEWRGTADPVNSQSDPTTWAIAPKWVKQ